jgi:hypothetical protein
MLTAPDVHDRSPGSPEPSSSQSSFGLGARIDRELLDFTGLVFEYWRDCLAIDERSAQPPPGLSVDSQFV